MQFRAEIPNSRCLQIPGRLPQEEAWIEVMFECLCQHSCKGPIPLPHHLLADLEVLRMELLGLEGPLSTI